MFKSLVALGLVAFGFTCSAIELTWGGFGSMYYGQALSSSLQPGGFSDRHADFTHFSLFGLNANAKLAPEWTAALQLIVTAANPGADPINRFTEWAYIAYAPGTTGLTFRLGRQRFPIWAAGESINTHFQLPYRAIPELVYNVAPFTSFSGLSVVKDWQLGDKRVSLALFGGTPNPDPDLSQTTRGVGSDLVGLKTSLDGDGWHVRAQASVHSFDGDKLSSPPKTYGGHVQNYSVGYRFDKYRVLSWGDYIVIKSTDGGMVPSVAPSGTNYGMPGGRFARSSEGGYVLVGYHVGDFTPRYTFASSNSGTGTHSGTLQSHTVGVNYQMNPNVILRGEFETLIARNNAGDTGVLRPNLNANGQGQAVYLGADFIF